MDTRTQPLPIVVEPIDGGHTSGVPLRRPRGLGTIAGLTLGTVAGITAIVLLVIHWQAVVTGLLTLLVIALLALLALSVLVRIATGGRLGSALIGGLVAAILLRRRR